MHIAGTVIHAPSRGELEVIDDACVSVNREGVIESVTQGEAPTDALTLAPGTFLLPGLIDCHVHAPQWPQMGTAYDLPLNEWLQQCTFPMEAKYSDLDFAAASYSSLIDTLLENGTTTATYYGSIHVAATQLLADIAKEKGQRAYIGKVAMDNPDQCPDFYRDASTTAAIDGTRQLVEYIRSLGTDRVQPVITPRFIPSCTDDALAEFGRMASEYDCHVQTHCSESDWQHHYVLERHGLKDTQSLDRFGLLTDKTVLAHGVLIDDEDMTTIRSSHSGIAHCPLSNLYFSNAVFPARRALDRQLKVGLGTDIAGGASASVLDNAAMAINMSRALEEGVDATAAQVSRGVDDTRIDFRDAFWMATAGGAEVLGLNAGTFAPGNVFDAIVLDTTVAASDLRVWGDDSAEDVLQKAIYGANQNNIATVWVQGEKVKG
ncbi:MAG: guanine deaminase [Pseudomonadota bacterium]